jgi:hypothetical protein
MSAREDNTVRGNNTNTCSSAAHEDDSYENNPVYETKDNDMMSRMFDRMGDGENTNNTRRRTVLEGDDLDCYNAGVPIVCIPYSVVYDLTNITNNGSTSEQDLICTQTHRQPVHLQAQMNQTTSQSVQQQSIAVTQSIQADQTNQPPNRKQTTSVVENKSVQAPVSQTSTSSSHSNNSTISLLRELELCNEVIKLRSEHLDSVIESMKAKYRNYMTQMINGINVESAVIDITEESHLLPTDLVSKINVLNTKLRGVGSYDYSKARKLALEIMDDSQSASTLLDNMVEYINQRNQLANQLNLPVQQPTQSQPVQATTQSQATEQPVQSQQSVQQPVQATTQTTIQSQQTVQPVQSQRSNFSYERELSGDEILANYYETAIFESEEEPLIIETLTDRHYN